LNNKLKVSVVMITYAHENYIREAIIGVLKQTANFDIELIIADDNSPDKTEDVVLSFSEHPNYNWIKYTKHSVNKGMMPNLKWALSQCTGDYIAFCEGDDYWFDPNKLQKQIDFLEANNEYVMSFHDVNVLKKDGSLHENFLTKLPSSWETLEDLAKYGQYIQTNTLVYRNITDKLPDLFFKYPTGDFAIELFIAQYGKIKYFPDVMSVYRYQVGVHSSLAVEDQTKLFNTWLLPIWLYFYGKDNKIISQIMIERIYIYLNNAIETPNGKIYSTYLYDGIGKEYCNSFLHETMKYYENKIIIRKEEAIHEHLKNAGIVYLLKVIFYKIKQNIGLVKR